MMKVVISALLAGVIFPGLAEARDECKDVLINKVMDFTDLRQTKEVRLALLARTSTSNSDQQGVQTGAKFPIEGIPVEGQGNWSRSQQKEMAKSLDLDLAIKESGSLLMLSGQSKIISAWKDCMLQKGGGIGTYFEPVADGSKQVLFHIQYLQDSLKKGSVQLPLILTSDVFLDDNVKAFGGGECLKQGFTIKPGEECTVQIVVPSAWTVVSIVMSFASQNNETRTSVSDTLLPRVSPSIETVSVPQTVPTLYSVGGANSTKDDLPCLVAPPTYTFVGPPKVEQKAWGAALSANSCEWSHVMNSDSTRICFTGKIVRTPRAPADYYCSWQVEAVAARVVMLPPK